MLVSATDEFFAVFSGVSYAKLVEFNGDPTCHAFAFFSIFKKGPLCCLVPPLESLPLFVLAPSLEVGTEDYLIIIIYQLCTFPAGLSSDNTHILLH